MVAGGFVESIRFFSGLVAAFLCLAPILSGHMPRAAEDSLSISLNMFSGRPRPRTILVESTVVHRLTEVLAAKLQNPLPFSSLPTMPSTPLYTGMFLHLNSSGDRGSTYLVREGWISTKNTEPCYRDSGAVLEKMSVSAAFTQDDLDAPGGPKPMAYLACMVPDSLHPDLPCPGTGILHPWRSPGQRGLSGLTVPGHDALGRTAVDPKAFAPYLFEPAHR